MWRRYNLFGKSDPVHFGALTLACVTMFQCATGGFTTVMYVQVWGCDSPQVAWYPASMCHSPSAQPLVGFLFFAVYVMLTVMLSLKLVLGVIIMTVSVIAKYDIKEEVTTPLVFPCALIPAEETLTGIGTFFRGAGLDKAAQTRRDERHGYRGP